MESIKPILVNGTEAAILLGIKKTAFYKHRSEIVANGVSEVQLGGRRMYVVKSIEKAIDDCVRSGNPLFQKVNFAL